MPARAAVHALDWLPRLVLIIAALLLLMAAMQHPGWQSRPSPPDPVAAAPRQAPAPLDADGLARVLREATVRSREVQ